MVVTHSHENALYLATSILEADIVSSYISVETQYEQDFYVLVCEDKSDQDFFEKYYNIKYKEGIHFSVRQEKINKLLQ